MSSMEENPAAKVVREKTDETSGDKGQNIEKDTEVSIVIQDKVKGYGLSSSIKERFEELDSIIDEKAGYTEDEKAGNTEAKIKRVPDALRSDTNLRKYFRPSTVNFGLYKVYGFEVEGRKKYNLAATFIKEHFMSDKEIVYQNIRKEMEHLRKCYMLDDDEIMRRYCYIRYDRVYDDFAWIFLIDGCLVLRHIYFTVNHIHQDKTYVYYGIDPLQFTRDLILLENQLPFKVLELLISACNKSEDMRKSVQLFAYKMTHMDGRKEKLLLPQEEPLHLLDLMRTSFIQSVRSQKKTSFTEQILEKSIHIIGMPLDILQRLIGMVLNILPRLVHDILLSKGSDKICFHPSDYSVEMLKAAGIKFRPSSTRSLTDISFSYRTLKLPPILVNELTATIFMNMIAYEMTAISLSPHKFGISFYVFLLASLIGQPQDVKELRYSGILYNNLKSDDEVVKLFKEMINLLPVLPSDSCNILSEIQKHCEKKHNIWIAQLKYRYFESPWTVFALLGAIIVLCLTFLQTVYTILSYYNQ